MYITIDHYRDVKWASYSIRTPATRLFDQQIFRHWLHRKLSHRQLLAPMTKMSSKWHIWLSVWLSYTILQISANIEEYIETKMSSLHFDEIFITVCIIEPKIVKMTFSFQWMGKYISCIRNNWFHPIRTVQKKSFTYLTGYAILKLVLLWPDTNLVMLWWNGVPWLV